MSIDRSIDTLAYRKAGGHKTTGSPQPIPGRCGAQLKYTGSSPDYPPRYCMSWPVKGRERCHLCGGKVPRGIAANKWVNGRASMTLPGDIAARYETLLQDEQLLSLRTEIALQRAYYQELINRGADGAVVSQEVLKAAGKSVRAWQSLTAARQSKSHARIASSLADLDTSMKALETAAEPAALESGIRSELRECWHELANLTDKEHKAVESLYNMITTERAFALRVAEQTAFMEAINQYIADVDTRMAIRRHVARRFEELARPTEYETKARLGQPAIEESEPHVIDAVNEETVEETSEEPITEDDL